MEEFIRITDERSIELLMKKTDYFHDSIIRELSIIKRGYVEKNFWMTGDAEPSDCRIIFHSQHHDSPVIEVVLKEVEQIKLLPSEIIDDLYVDCDKNGVRIYPQGHAFADDSYIEVSEMYYRILDKSYLGDNLFTVTPIEI